ncbi:MAG: hypothetical protein WC735_01400 [Candidatus Paceibacterota bacterium]|jgi:hypothetical protein
MSDEENSINRLGIDQTSLGKLKPEDLNNAKTAGMVLNYLTSLESENTQLKTKNETLSTYVSSYNNQKNNSKIAATLSLISVVSIGFAINILTSDSKNYGGYILLIIGIVLQLYSTYLTYKE